MRVAMGAHRSQKFLYGLAYDLHAAGDLEKKAEVFAHFGAVIDEEDSLRVFMRAHVTSMS